MKRNKIIIFTGAAVLGLVAAGSLFFHLFSVTLTTGNGFAMSTTIDQQVYAKKAVGKETVDQTMSALKAFEERFSMYKAQSEITRINENAGQGYVAVSEQTFALLKKAVSFCERSDGLFDITVAPVTRAWGINSDSPRVPAQQERDELRKLVDYRDILFDDQARAVMLRREGQAIDLGAVAKGEACNVVRDLYLKNNVRAGLLSIGGNLMAIGQKPGGADFVLGIRDPRGMQTEVIGTVTLTDEVLSTSGDYERVFEQNNKRYHHIMDPATAAPAETDWMSVTVICQDGAYADFLSTWLFLLGREETLNRMDGLDAGVIAVDKDYTVYVSPGLREIFSPVDTGKYTYDAGE